MISKVVRELREKKGMSSRILARRVGKNNTWISQIETGKIAHPDLKALKHLLRLLDCTEEQIEQIILTEFPDLEKFPKKHSKNRTDYKIEKKVLVSKREKKNYGVTEITSFQSQVMTEREFLLKCQKDAHQLYCEIKQLPRKTLETLMDYLIDDI
jgi:transcriptional regulator with XRE-family HTH domain